MAQLAGWISPESGSRVVPPKAVHHCSSAGALSRLSVADEGKKLQLLWDDDRETSFHSVWLRHNCRCSECFSSAGQKTAALDHCFRNGFPSKFKIASAELNGSEVSVRWDAGEWSHSGHFSLTWLRDIDAVDKKVQPFVAQALPQIAFSEVLDTDEGLWRMLMNIEQYGMCLIQGVPDSEESVRKVAERIGPVQGDVHSVICVDDLPQNITYTDSALPLHTDQAFWEYPPAIMMLHCFRNDKCVTGGESVLVDAYPVVEELSKKHPKQLSALTKVPVRYKNRIYYERNQFAEVSAQGPLIELNENRQLKMIREQIEDFYEAYDLLLKKLNEPVYKITHQLQPGDMYIVNNHRVLHGRNAFKLNGGERHLRGLFQSADYFNITLAVLKEKLK